VASKNYDDTGFSEGYLRTNHEREEFCYYGTTRWFALRWLDPYRNWQSWPNNVIDDTDTHHKVTYRTATEWKAECVEACY